MNRLRRKLTTKLPWTLSKKLKQKSKRTMPRKLRSSIKKPIKLFKKDWLLRTLLLLLMLNTTMPKSSKLICSLSETRQRKSESLQANPSNL